MSGHTVTRLRRDLWLGSASIAAARKISLLLGLGSKVGTGDEGESQERPEALQLPHELGVLDGLAHDPSPAHPLVDVQVVVIWCECLPTHLVIQGVW